MANAQDVQSRAGKQPAMAEPAMADYLKAATPAERLQVLADQHPNAIPTLATFFQFVRQQLTELEEKPRGRK
jgi:hypothetical protein